MQVTNKRESLQQLQNCFNLLLQELEKVKIPSNHQPYKEIPKDTNKRKYSPQPERVKIFPEKDPVIKQQQEKSAKNTQTRVESVSPPPPKASPSPRPEEVEAKFRDWELNEEIARMKAEMRSPNACRQTSPSSQTGKQQNSTQSNKAPSQAEKDKITRAYGILGLQANASQTEVKQAYRTLVKKWHPDLFVNQPQLQKQAQEKMHLVNDAYTILSDK